MFLMDKVKSTTGVAMVDIMEDVILEMALLIDN